MELFILCFFFVLILAVPVDKDSSVSPNVRLHVPSVSLPAARRLLHQEECGGSSGDGPSVSG